MKFHWHTGHESKEMELETILLGINRNGLRPDSVQLTREELMKIADPIVGKGQLKRICNALTRGFPSAKDSIGAALPLGDSDGS